MDIEYYKNIRRKLHTIPELGYCERKTASFITKELDRLDVDYKKDIVKTGIVAWIKKGSIRTYHKDTQKIIEDRIEKITKSISESFDMSATFTHHKLYPAVINRYITSSLKSAIETAGEENIVTDYVSSFASEDFSFFLEEKEDIFVWLGTKPPNKKGTPLHSQNYDFNDDIIEIGINYWVNLVKIELNNKDI